MAKNINASIEGLKIHVQHIFRIVICKFWNRCRIFFLLNNNAPLCVGPSPKNAIRYAKDCISNMTEIKKLSGYEQFFRY